VGLTQAEHDTDEWGIARSWLDDADQPRQPSQATLHALRAVIGTPPPDLEQRAPIVVVPGRTVDLPTGELVCEDGTRRAVGGPAPDDLPLGYHRLHPPAGPSRRVVVSPGRCHQPEGLRTWGWAVQLYDTRSRDSWAIGDLADLRAVRELGEAHGAGFLLVNPLHAVAPTGAQEASPYLPATRRVRNPLYLRVAEVPGARMDDQDAAAGAALSAGAELDRDAGWALHRRVLRRVFAAGEPVEFRTWRQVRSWSTGRGGACWPNVTAVTSGSGPRSCVTRTPPRCAPRQTRRRWRSTPGCSGVCTCNCSGRAWG